MIKYLYVLTSNEHDYYLEQTLLSMVSLRLHMPKAFIALLVDNRTEASLTGKRNSIIDLVNEFKSVPIEDKFNQKTRSRWLKTSMRQNIAGDFLYIDGDTIISADLSSLEEMDIDVGAVLDSHVYLDEYVKYHPDRLKDIETLSFSTGVNRNFTLNVYFNGGVLFCRDNKQGHELFSEWHRLWLQYFEMGGTQDQPSLNLSNLICGNVIKELGGIWNCQVLDDGGLRYLYNAKIIHYFSSRPGKKAYIASNDEFITSIKETGIVSEEIVECIKDPKSLFAPNTRLILLEESSRTFYDSAFFGIAKRLFGTKLGAAIEFILSRVRKIIYIPIRRKFSKR